MKANQKLIEACQAYLHELEVKGILSLTKAIEDGMKLAQENGCEICHPDVCCECQYDDACPFSLSEMAIVL